MPSVRNRYKVSAKMWRKVAFNTAAIFAHEITRAKS